LRSNSQLNGKPPPPPPTKTRLKYRNIPKSFVGTFEPDINSSERVTPSPIYESTTNKSSFIVTKSQTKTSEESKKTNTSKIFKYNLFQTEKDKKKINEKKISNKKVKPEKNLHLKEIIGSTSADITQFILPLLHFSSKCSKKDNINFKYNNLVQKFNEISEKPIFHSIDKYVTTEIIPPKVPPRLNFLQKLSKKLHQDSSPLDSLTNITPTNLNYTTLDKSSPTNLNDSQMTLKSTSHHNHTNLEILKKEIDKTINDLSTIQTEVTNRIQQNARSLNQVNIIDSSCNTDISMYNAVFTIKYDQNDKTKSNSEDTALNNSNSSSSENSVTRKKSISSSLLDKIHFNIDDLVYSNSQVRPKNNISRLSDDEHSTTDNSSFIEQPNYINRNAFETKLLNNSTKRESREVYEAKENLRLKLEKELNKRILEKVANSAIKQLDSELEQVKSFNINTKKNDSDGSDKTVNPSDRDSNQEKNKNNCINEQIVLRIMPLKRNSIPKYNTSTETRIYNDIISDYRKSFYNENVCFASKTDSEYSPDISNLNRKKIKFSLNKSPKTQTIGPIRVIKDARNKFKNNLSNSSTLIKKKDYSTITDRIMDLRRPHSYERIDTNETTSNNNTIKKSSENDRPVVKIVNKSPKTAQHENNNNEVEIKIIRVKDSDEKSYSPTFTKKPTQEEINSTSYCEIPIIYKNSSNSKVLIKSPKSTNSQYTIRYPSTGTIMPVSDTIEEKLKEFSRSTENNNDQNTPLNIEEKSFKTITLNNTMNQAKKKNHEIYSDHESFDKSSLLIEEKNDIESLIKAKKKFKQFRKQNLINFENYFDSLIRIP
jgi:hypothetical protein